MNRPTPPSRPVLLTCIATVILAIVVGATQLRTGSHPADPSAAGQQHRAVAVRPTATPRPSTTAMTTPAARSGSTTTVSAKRSRAAASAHAQALRQVARSTVSRLIRRNPSGAVSVAAQDLVTGARYSAGSTSDMWTASAYKLLVLEALLIQTQQSGGPSSGQLDEAAAMIGNSDNKAGYDLFEQAGGNSGLQALFSRLGMSHTVPGVSDPTFTRTSAPDFLRALRPLVGGAVLTPASRRVAHDLMAKVEADQRWGVGAAADRGTNFVNKNGWLAVDNSNGPDESDDDRWIVTSVGVVTVGGHRTLLAVLTQHQDSFGDGVALTEKLARATAAAL